MAKKQPSFEDRLLELEALVRKMEEGSMPLNETLTAYEEGMKLVKSCNEKIEKIEKQILVLGGESMEDTNNGQYF